MITLRIMLFLTLCLVVWGIVAISDGTPPDGRQIVERIEDNCQREFRSQGEEAVVNCQLQLSIRLALEQADRRDAAKADQIDRLYRQSR